MTLNDRVTLNLGVRADFNKGGVPDYERLAVGTPSIAQALNAVAPVRRVPGIPDIVDWKLISPRFGITFQPTESGRSVLRGSFGVYYEGNVVGNWDFPPPGSPTQTSSSARRGRTSSFSHTTSRLPRSASIRTSARRARSSSPPASSSSSAPTCPSRSSTSTRTPRTSSGWEILDGVYEMVPYTDYFGNTRELYNAIVDPGGAEGKRPGELPGSRRLRAKVRRSGRLVQQEFPRLLGL